ncbi:hypothetical protein BO71DRAFT_364690 [Aspergillus ellipticus CBS 707.79]|uniref:Methyltransferase n=1 Tax=Aspergillus ellipticus CBS 707.79 TaxID=1448320 RepID=A0A319CUC1_9EURO|nr:hypothetical protein BO71DRAFT_364690 [Aspergillus ellipticus CBS 707.79]
MSLPLLTAQYFQQLDPRVLTLPDGPTLLLPTTQQALYADLFDESSPRPLPTAPYRTRVLKMIIAKLEAAISDPEEDEIYDPLLETLGTLISTPKPSATQQAQQLTHVTFTAPSQCPESQERRTIITSESRNAIVTAGTTGHRTWEAALHLATYLSSPQGSSHITGKRVLELGAGTGLVSMFCAKYLNPEIVVATDLERGLMEQIAGCSVRNGLEKERFRGCIWEWGQELQLDGEEERQEDGGKLGFDVAFGADLIYDTDLVPLLVQTVKTLFTTYGIQEFLISATLRNEDTFGTFLSACEEKHLAVNRIPFDSPKEEDQTGFFHSTMIPIHTYRISLPSLLADGK